MLGRSHWALLDEEERTRAISFRDVQAADLFTLGAVLLRVVVGGALDVLPDAVPVQRQCPQCGRPHGRPRIAGSDLGVSVAHSADIVAVAVAARVEVGVDVEHVRSFDYTALLDEVCTPLERTSIDSERAFFRVWTLKEAVLKATGDGLTEPMGGIELASLDDRLHVVRYPGRPGLMATVQELHLTSGISAAVAVLAPPPVRISTYDASGLLG